MNTLVSYEANDGIATITMDDGKVNALSRPMIAELNAAFDQAASESLVTVFTGRGSIFSAGFDLKTMSNASEGMKMVNEGFELALRLLEFSQPVIVACNGHSIAMGAMLMLSADYRIGVEGQYRITTNEVAIGMTMPWTGLEICRQRLATTHFYRAVSLAEPFLPNDAVVAGFLDELVTSDELANAAARRSKEFAAFPNTTYVAVKKRTRATAVAAIRGGHIRDLFEQGGH